MTTEGQHEWIITTYGSLPADVNTMGTRSSMMICMYSLIWGISSGMLTPYDVSGDFKANLHLEMCCLSTWGYMEPAPITPDRSISTTSLQWMSSKLSLAVSAQYYMHALTIVCSPRAPALLTALASFHPLAQIMPACMMGFSIFSNLVISFWNMILKTAVRTYVSLTIGWQLQCKV